MQDVDALLEALAAHPNELVGAALEPRRHHAPVGMPDRAEPLPVAGVAPHRPAFDDVADRLTFQRVAAHCRPLTVRPQHRALPGEAAILPQQLRSQTPLAPLSGLVVTVGSLILASSRTPVASPRAWSSSRRMHPLLVRTSWSRSASCGQAEPRLRACIRWTKTR